MTADAVEFGILGRVKVKKNSRRMRRNWRTGASFSVPSEAFEDFQDDMIQQLRDRKLLGLNMMPPYAIRYEFHMKGKAASDLDNMVCSINDILQEAGIIGDDKDIIEMQVFKIEKAEHYLTKIRIWQKEKNTTPRG